MHNGVVKGIIFFILIQGSLKGNGQKKDFHESTLGAGFSLNKIDKSITVPLTPGIGVRYTSSINSFLDWQLKLDGSFIDSIEKLPTSPEKKLLLGVGGQLRARVIRGVKWIQPFVLLGIQGLGYNGKGYFLIPFGGGLEFRYKNIFLTLNAEYNLSLSENLNNYSQYSIIISGIVGSKNKKRPTKSNETFKLISIDTDGDGIIDSEDSCREVPGIAKFNGCPDTDGDGIENKKDQCPLIFGVLKYNGCPVPDTDNDGINDEEDSCITQPGVLRYHGCPVPDTDGDGINNEEDSCINIPGPKSNNGCPVIKKELTEEMQRAAQNILFKTGSYQLLRSSYPALNKVIFILNENPDLNLVIEGHTDNEGTEQSNQLLSENRSNTVLNYLKTHGIRETRLKAVAYGQMKPIDTNATPEGRARNRRVELKLNY